MKYSRQALAAFGFALIAGAAGAQGQGNGPGMAHFLEEWDMNTDGTVTADDIAARRVEQFDMFDLNGDGAIAADEQANMAQTIAGQEEVNQAGHGMNGPGPRIHGAMTAEYNDVDANGIISAAEWAAGSARLFADLDRNGDGAINQQDFGRNG